MHRVYSVMYLFIIKSDTHDFLSMAIKIRNNKKVELIMEQ